MDLSPFKSKVALSSFQNSVTLVTVAEFMFPDEDAPGTVFFSGAREDIEPGSRDPNVPPGRPSGAIGVRFYDQVVVDLTSPSAYTIRCPSARLNPSGVFFYGGTAYTKSEVQDQTGTGTMNAAAIDLVLSNMDTNGWASVIVTPDGLILPFEAQDTVV